MSARRVTPPAGSVNFTPTLFVSIGGTGAMFTLREKYLHECVDGYRRVYREIRSRHLQNLSIDADAAFAKATDIARDRGQQLTTSREDMTAQLREIQRATPAQLRERRVEQAKENTRQADYRDFWIMVHLRERGPGMFVLPAGKYQGRSFADIAAFDRPYLEWMADQAEPAHSRFSVETELRRQCLHTWLENHPDETPVLDEYFSEPGERIDLTLTVLRVHGFSGDYGFSQVVTMRDRDGRTFSTFYSGSKWTPKAGESAQIRATVKKHVKFRGEKQTQLTRVTPMQEQAQ